MLCFVRRPLQHQQPPASSRATANASSLRCASLNACYGVQEARSYHDTKYWLDRAKVRLDRVNWSEGASRLTMDVVRDAIHDMKRERAGELKPVYVKPSMWGELRF